MGEGPARARLRALRAQAAGRATASRPACSIRCPPHPQSDKQALLGAARIAANAARAVAAGLGRARRWRRRRRCTRSTLRPAAWRSRRPATTPRSPPSRTARIPTAASSSRGSTTTARTWPRRSAPSRRRASASSSATAAAGHGSSPRGRRATSTAARPCGSCARPPASAARARRSARSPGRSRRSRSAGCCARRGVEAHSTYTFRRSSDPRRVEPADQDEPPPQRRGPVPVDRRRQGGRLGDPQGRHGGQARRSPRGARRRRVLGPERDLGLRGRAASTASRAAIASIVQPKPQSSAPDPGPTLVVRLTNRLRKKRTVRFSTRIAIARDLDAAKRAVR